MYTSGMSGTEINGEVYNLDYFFLALLLLEATICDKFYGMTWYPLYGYVKIHINFKDIYILIERTTLHQMWHMPH